MASAARLKDVILLLRSMVKTPSPMVSKMVRQGALRADVRLQNMGHFQFEAQYLSGFVVLSFSWNSP
jgi:hypothetical protein